MLRTVLVVCIALAATGCDQISKYQAVAALTDGLQGSDGWRNRWVRYLEVAHPAPTSSQTVVEGAWRFAYAENPGAAFSLLHDAPFGRAALLVVGLLMCGLLSLHALRASTWPAHAGAALALGGALGNLLDRARLGYVIDFVQWHYGDRYAWPTFNVADVCILAGALLMMGAGWRAAYKPDH